MLKSFKDSDLVIFISNYAQEIIKKFKKKPLKNCLINHGVDMNDSEIHRGFPKIYNFKEPFIIYPSVSQNL